MPDRGRLPPLRIGPRSLRVLSAASLMHDERQSGTCHHRHIWKDARKRTDGNRLTVSGKLVWARPQGNGRALIR